MFLPTLTFWGLNALLLVVDTTGKPSFITRYRIQLDKNNPVCETPAGSESLVWSYCQGLKCWTVPSVRRVILIKVLRIRDALIR